MAEIIIMPKQGLQMTEGLITKWLKNEGDTVLQGEPLFEMETDKLAITIDSTASGTVLKLLRQEHETVAITEPIAIIGTPGEDISGLLTQASKKCTPAEVLVPSLPLAPAAAQQSANERVFATPRAKMAAEECGLAVEDVHGSGPEGLVIERDILAYVQPKATPTAKKLAQINGVDLKKVSGSGVNGKIMKQDVLHAAAAPTTPTSQPETGRETVMPLSGMRRAIASNMSASLQTMAQANHRMRVDMRECVRLRQKLKEDGIKITYTDILVLAVAKALMQFPVMNSTMRDNCIIAKHYVNMGIAVALDSGLIVPNLKNAQELSLKQIHEQVVQLANKAKEGTLSMEEYSGGTFTITNLGMYEIDEFTPIINPPEAGILGVGAIVDTPVAIEGRVEIRPVMTLSLTYDHRIVDGAPAAQFLQQVKKLLSNPYLLL